MHEIIYNSGPLGPLRIKSSGEEIVEISFINKAGLETFPVDKLNTAVENSPAVLKECVIQLDKYFSGKLTHFDFPINQPGTIFQQKVWNELVGIQYGKTESYLSLSKKLGNTKAIRAVGTANGKNNIAIVVPCHRVIGSNGSLVGYAGDLWRKKWLLEHEAKNANGLLMLF